MAKKANRPSSIDRLPPELQDAIGQLRRRGRTIDEILAHIRTMDAAAADVSRSALGRHVKSLAEVLDDMKLSDSISAAIAQRHGSEPEDNVALANMALLQNTITKIVMAKRTDDDGAPVELSPKEVRQLTGSFRDLVLSRKTDMEREHAAKKEMAKAVDRVGREKGLTAETVADIKHAILGVAA